MVDVVNEIDEKAFLGREFLTWILLASLKNGDVFDIPKVGHFELHFERQVVLEGEDTGAKRITIAGSSPATAAEVLSALRTGKVVSKARLRFLWEEATWEVSITGGTFDFSGIRVPVPHVPEVEELFTMRVGELQKFLKFLNSLFHYFLSLRLNPKKWNATLKEIGEAAI